MQLECMNSCHYHSIDANFLIPSIVLIVISVLTLHTTKSILNFYSQLCPVVVLFQEVENPFNLC